MRRLQLLLVGAVLLGSCSGDGTAITTSPGDPPTVPDGVEPIRGLVVLGMSDGEIQGSVGDPAALVGDIIATPEETRLCGSIMDSFPPQCSRPGSVVLQGADLGGLPDTVTEQGITWTLSSVVAIGEWTGLDAVTVDRFDPIVIGEVAALVGSIDSRQGRWVLCTAPDASCEVTAVPLVGFSGPSSGGRSVIVVGTWADEGFAVDDVARDEG